MPHLRVRGVKPEVVQKLSENLNTELAAMIQTSPDNFTIEHVGTLFFLNGKAELGYPFVEVLWFDRPTEIRSRVAEHLTMRLRALVGPTDVAVVFVPLKPQDYFENGKHF